MIYLLLITLVCVHGHLAQSQFHEDMNNLERKEKQISMIRNKIISHSDGLTFIQCDIRGALNDYKLKLFVQKDFFELTIEYPENFYFLQAAGRFCKLSYAGHLDLRGFITTFSPNITYEDFNYPQLTDPYSGQPIDGCQNYLTVEPLTISKYNPPRDAFQFDLPRTFRKGFLRNALDEFSTGQAHFDQHNEKVFMAWKGYLLFMDLENLVVKRGNQNATISRKFIREHRSQYVRSFSQLYNVWF